jgi:hypothetical protein
LADIDFDVSWVTPYQISAHSEDGPVLVGYSWSDAPTVRENRSILEKCGYLPGIPFNKVIDRALSLCGIARDDLYITQAFHLLTDSRSQPIPDPDVEISFDAVTRHELTGRTVIALGGSAARACRRHGIPHVAVRHPSARGLDYQERASELARAIIETGLLP